MAKQTPATKPTEKSENEKQRPSFLAESSVLTITIPWSAVDPVYRSTRQKLAKRVKLDGFRKGKVPAKLVEETVGNEQIIENTLQELLPKYYSDQMAATKKRPISFPEFKPLAVEQGSDWSVEAYFAERPTIELKDYKKIVKEAKKEAKTAQDKQKKAEKSPEKPEKDTAELESAANQATLETIYRALITKLQPPVPELVLKQESRQELKQLSQQLAGMKLTIEDYVKQRQMTFEQLSEEVTISVLGRLQLGFILEAVVESEKLAVEDTEVEEYIKTAVAPAMREQYEKNEEYRGAVRQTVLRKKIADYLLAL